MLPLILLAGGAYLIGKAVLEDDNYAEGGMMKGRKPDYESKKGQELTKKAKELWNGFDEEQRMSFLYYQTGFRTIDGRYDDEIKKQAKYNWDDLAIRIQMIVEESIYFSDMAKGGTTDKFYDNNLRREWKMLLEQDDLNIKKSNNTDVDKDRPYILDINQMAYFYESKKERDSDYGTFMELSNGKKMADGGMMAKGVEVEKHIFTKQQIIYILNDVGYEVDDNNFDELAINEGFKYKDGVWYRTDDFARGGNVEGKSGSKFKIEMWNSFDDMAYEKKKPSRIVYSDSEDELRELGEDNRSSKLYMKRKGKYMNITTFLEKGGEVKDYSGNYYSTYDFVAVNKLEKEADSLFGKDWEAEDDASQILELTDSLGGGYTTYVSEDDEDWQRLRYKHSLNNETNDSNYDIFVVHYGRKKKK
jgi:hypothetical protein